MNERIVITGMGLVSPLGLDVESFWQALLAGRSGIDAITAFDTSEYAVKRGGEVKGFDPARYMAPATIGRVGRASQYAIAAARQALDDAGLAPGSVPPHRVGVVMGTTEAESQAIERLVGVMHREGPAGAPADLFWTYPCSHIAANVAAEFGFEGPTAMLPTACAAGNYAIGYGLDLMRQGRADVMVVGGSDPISEIAYAGFSKINGMAPEVPRPFSRDRQGMMVSEAAGVLVLERLASARARGARIHAEVAGYGLSADAYNMAHPHPEGEGALLAMQDALRHAELTAADVDYVNAHGTGTGANDKTETTAMKRLFGERASRVPVTSIKSNMGHTMGAASALEAILCALVTARGVIPPTANYREADPDCDLDYVPHTPRSAEVRVAMSNAYGFGGNVSSLIVVKHEP